MYCPKCASTATPGQRFCRVCGTNLGLIVDAMDGKRSPVDFDSLKDDLRELGLSLRVGFEEAKAGFNQKIKDTHRLRKARDRNAPPALTPIPIRVKNIKGGSTRRHSLQQGILALLGGGASSAALYFILNTANAAGFLGSIEQLLASKLDSGTLTGLVAVIQLLWVLPLVTSVRGVAHLINGIFFPSRPEPEVKEVVIQSPQRVSFRVESPFSTPMPVAAPVEVPTNELEQEPFPEPQMSVTEDETVRLGNPKQPA
jgi:hypothetical protein